MADLQHTPGRGAVPAAPGGRGLLLVLAALMVGLLIAGGVHLLRDDGGDHGADPAPAPAQTSATVTSSSSRAPDLGADAAASLAVVNAYAAAFAADDANALAAVLAPDVRRVGDNGDPNRPRCVRTTTRTAVLATSRRQFPRVRKYAFPEATTSTMKVDGGIASLSTRAFITAKAGTLGPERISFKLRRTRGEWRITRITAGCKPR